MSFVVRGLLGVASLAWPALAQAQTAPAAASPAPASVRVYMRNQGAPLTYSVHPKSGHASPTWCISPCDARLLPGDYQLKLNGVKVGDTLTLRQPGTLHGEYQSYAGTRQGAWLALNVGGIVGGVFMTVGLASSSYTAFAIGGGVLAGATAIFFITYRSDRAKLSFTADLPPDVRGMPDPANLSGTRHAALERSSIGSPARGLGFRIAF
ncbi:MAG TPA: hypothetical protein VGC79_11945, partial [Polyangiaceae bacterium]